VEREKGRAGAWCAAQQLTKLGGCVKGNLETLKEIYSYK